MHFAVRFAPFYPAFCTILPCVLLHLALRFAAKRPLNTISCVFIHYIINFYAITLHSLSGVNKPPRELNICVQVSC